MADIHDHLSKAHMMAIDRDYWNPDERATGVHQIISAALEEDRKKNPKDSPTNWDVACWALAYLSQTVVGLGVVPLIEIMKRVNAFIWSIHYSNFKELYGAPDKRKTGGRYRSDTERNVTGGSVRAEDEASRTSLRDGQSSSSSEHSQLPLSLSSEPKHSDHWEGAD